MGEGKVRTLLLATAVGVGLIGIGSILGGTTIYYFLIRRKFQDIFTAQRSFSLELEGLRREINQMRSQNADGPPKVLKSSLKRQVKFVGGYETADDEEFVTASSSDLSDLSDSDDDHGGYGDLARRVPGSENLLNGIGDVSKEVRNRSIRSIKPKKENSAQLFFKKVDVLFEGDTKSQQEAYSSLKINEHNPLMSESPDFWWRLAKATHLKATAAGNNGDQQLKKIQAFEAFSYAEKALQLNSDAADVHKWYAITLGSKGEFISTNDKILNGFKFKEHIDRAISINSTDSTLHYLLGRFCYEISQLSWLERKVASTLFSTPPTSSFSDALEHFLSSENIGKPFKDNRLYIAKCYIEIGDNGNAIQWLNRASSLPVLTPTDKAAHAEINSLLLKFRGH